MLRSSALSTPPEPRSAAVAVDQEKRDVDFGYQPTGVGSIGDLVFDDLGDDGSYDPGAGDAGIDGVTVRLYEDGDGDGVLDAEDALVATAVTAGTGLLNSVPDPGGP